MNQMNLRIQFEIVCACLWLSDCGFTLHAIFFAFAAIVVVVSCDSAGFLFMLIDFRFIEKPREIGNKRICKNNESKCFNYTWNRTHKFPTHIQQLCFMFDACLWPLFILFLPIWCACNSFPLEIQHTKSFSPLDWPHEMCFFPVQFRIDTLETSTKNRCSVCVVRQNGEIDRSKPSKTHAYSPPKWAQRQPRSVYRQNSINRNRHNLHTLNQTHDSLDDETMSDLFTLPCSNRIQSISHCFFFDSMANYLRNLNWMRLKRNNSR